MDLAASKGCINLGPGYCNLRTDHRVLRAAQEAIARGDNYYTECDGIPQLKRAIAERYAESRQLSITPENVLVTGGSTGGLESICKCFLEPGDEVVMFEPFYQYHLRQVVDRGATVRLVRLSPPDWTFSLEELQKAITPRTKLLVMANPNNPTGKVFTRRELEDIGAICRRSGVISVCDEVYEYLVDPEHPHISLAGMPEMFNHTLTLSSAGKTFRVTGWRVGWLVGPTSVIKPLSVKSDETYLCAPAPLQQAVAHCMALPADYFEGIQNEFRDKRRLIIEALKAGGFTPTQADGAFYVLASYEQFGYRNDLEALRSVIEDFRVLTLPGSAFYRDSDSTGMLRFCFAIEDDLLKTACDRLAGARVRN